MGSRILIIGAKGQIGTELTEELRSRHGADTVVASDIKYDQKMANEGPFAVLDVMDKIGLSEIIKSYKVDTIYNLAALLSATGEQRPDFAWKLNMEGLLNTLNAVRDLKLKRLFWPSSIAVFGPSTPRINTPQVAVMDPNTVYGISKLAGERWCEYYAQRWNVDVRSIRYPGLIGYKSQPGGGTTDYAVDIFHKAILEGKYTSFLGPESALPMMYMPDAIRATLQLMDAPSEQIKVRSSYNLGGISFTPKEIADEITKHIPGFVCDYDPDSRQKIADSWPASIDDTAAQADWGWRSGYDLPAMVEDMILNIKKAYNNEPVK